MVRPGFPRLEVEVGNKSRAGCPRRYPRLTGQSTARGEMRAAAVQLNSTNDKDRNMATADRLVREATADGADLVVLPEKFNVLGEHDDYVAGAEPLDGPTISWARDVARELGIDLVAGSIVERREGRDKLGNTSVHVGPDGELKAVYRKIHMFDVVVGGIEYRESASEEPGDEIVLSEAADGDPARPDRLLRPSLPRALPDPRDPRGARDHAARGLHQGHGAGALGDPRPCACGREPGVHGRGRPDRHASSRTRRASAAR